LKSASLVIENLVVSNNPDTPCCKDDGFHGKWQIQFVSGVIKDSKAETFKVLWGQMKSQQLAANG
jgi:hypothetical protein